MRCPKCSDCDLHARQCPLCGFKVPKKEKPSTTIDGEAYAEGAKMAKNERAMAKMRKKIGQLG